MNAWSLRLLSAALVLACLAAPAEAARVRSHGLSFNHHTGSFSGALVYVAVMLVAATILPIVTRKPGADTPEHPRWPFFHRPAHR